MSAREPCCSVVVVTYESVRHLPACLDSLRAQTLLQSGGLEVIVVDNGSHDGAVAFVRAHYPEFIVIALSDNLGYAGGNNVGFARARGRYLAALNPDTVVEPACFAELVAALEEDAYALATPKICLLAAPETINTCGNGLHLGGYGFVRGLGEPASAYDRRERVAAISGCCFVASRLTLTALGGFDPAFFLYVEDADLSLRARLHGDDLLFVPSAVVLHQYHLAMSPRKFYYLERNRYQLLLKSLSTGSLFRLSPALALIELAAWAYAAGRGRSYLWAKLRGHAWLLAHASDLLRRRRITQRTRRVADRELLAVFSPTMPLHDLATNRIAVRVNRLLCRINLWLLRRITR